MTTAGIFDYVLLAVILILPIVEWLWYGPRCIRAIRTRVPGARGRLYRAEVIALWAVTLCVLGLWTAKARPWGGLHLGASSALRFASGLLVAAIIVALFVLQMQKVQKALRRPRAVAKLREKFASVELVVPETDRERRGFWLLSVTAGICEEVIYRGFLLWLITPWDGLIAAILVSTAAFGFMHIYLGVAQVPRTAIIGFVLALVVVASGSLWPAIIIHTAIDLTSGEAGFRVTQASLANASAAAPLTS
jgi:hypothetical protein